MPTILGQKPIFVTSYEINFSRFFYTLYDLFFNRFIGLYISLLFSYTFLLKTSCPLSNYLFLTHTFFFLSYSYCLFRLIYFLHITLSLSPSNILSISFYFLKLSQLRRYFILSVFHSLTSSQVHARMKSYK